MKKSDGVANEDREGGTAVKCRNEECQALSKVGAQRMLVDFRTPHRDYRADPGAPAMNAREYMQ